MLNKMGMLAAFMQEHGCPAVNPAAPTWDEAIRCEGKLLDIADDIARNHGYNPQVKNEERVAWAQVPEYKRAKELWGKAVTMTEGAYPDGQPGAVDFDPDDPRRAGKRGGSYSSADIASIKAIMARAGCPATFDETDPDDIDGSLEACIQKVADSDPKLAEEMRKLQHEAGVRFDRGGRRTRKIGPLRKGQLTSLGYHPSRKTTSRHRALSKAVKKYGRLSTLRKVNAVAVLTKRRAPLTSKKYRADVKYLQKRYF